MRADDYIHFVNLKHYQDYLLDVIVVQSKYEERGFKGRFIYSLNPSE